MFSMLQFFIILRLCAGLDIYVEMVWEKLGILDIDMK